MRKNFLRIKTVLSNPLLIVAKIINGRAKFLSTEVYLQILFYSIFKKKINFQNPVTYNEKLQWLKLNDHNNSYINLVDKYEVRQIVSSRIGEKHLVPIFGVWDEFDAIDFSKLPNKFVLKCTHDSGSVIICTDKAKFDVRTAKGKINKWLKSNHYWKSREWAYQFVKPRIIAEEYLEDLGNVQLKDYKFFCFSGEPKLLYVASDRDKGADQLKFDYFDMNFNKLKVSQQSYPNSDYHINKPEMFNEMIEICKVLSQGIPHVRIDLYEVNNKVYFGEYTFFHHGGMVPFNPEKTDRDLGDLINIRAL